jgi:hypothetical protein
MNTERLRDALNDYDDACDLGTDTQITEAAIRLAQAVRRFVDNQPTAGAQ